MSDRQKFINTASICGALICLLLKGAWAVPVHVTTRPSFTVEVPAGWTWQQGAPPSGGILLRGNPSRTLWIGALHYASAARAQVAAANLKALAAALIPPGARFQQPHETRFGMHPGSSMAVTLRNGQIGWLAGFIYNTDVYLAWGTANGGHTSFLSRLFFHSIFTSVRPD